MAANPTDAGEGIENSGSTARDHLANERTFLAWVRTGLGFVGIGAVLQKLMTERPAAIAAGAALLFVATGLAQLIYALIRYRRTARLLTAGRYAPASSGPATLVMLCIALALAVAVLVLI